jgi:hypothetical protein
MDRFPALSEEGLGDQALGGAGPRRAELTAGHFKLAVKVKQSYPCNRSWRPVGF